MEQGGQSRVQLSIGVEWKKQLQVTNFTRRLGRSQAGHLVMDNMSDTIGNCLTEVTFDFLEEKKSDSVEVERSDLLKLERSNSQGIKIFDFLEVERRSAVVDFLYAEQSNLLEIYAEGGARVMH